MGEFKTDNGIPVHVEKIWDYQDSWRADGGKIPGGLDDGP